MNLLQSLLIGQHEAPPIGAGKVHVLKGEPPQVKPQQVKPRPKPAKAVTEAQKSVHRIRERNYNAIVAILEIKGNATTSEIATLMARTNGAVGHFMRKLRDQGVVTTNGTHWRMK